MIKLASYGLLMIVLGSVLYSLYAFRTITPLASSPLFRDERVRNTLSMRLGEVESLLQSPAPFAAAEREEGLFYRYASTRYVFSDPRRHPLNAPAVIPHGLPICTTPEFLEQAVFALVRKDRNEFLALAKSGGCTLSRSADVLVLTHGVFGSSVRIDESEAHFWTTAAVLPIEPDKSGAKP